MAKRSIRDKEERDWAIDTAKWHKQHRANLGENELNANVSVKLTVRDWLHVHHALTESPDFMQFHDGGFAEIELAVDAEVKWLLSDEDY